IPLLLYSDSIRWDGRAFAASAQPVYVAIGVAVGLTQSAASTAVILLMPWAVWAVAAASVALGVLASYPLVRLVSPEAALRVAKVPALLGGVQLLVVALLCPPAQSLDGQREESGRQPPDQIAQHERRDSLRLRE